MKITKPITVIVAAVLLVVLSLSLFPTRIPGTAIGANQNFRGAGNTNANGRGNFTAGGGQGFTGNLPAGGNGDTAGGTTGGTTGGTNGGFSANGNTNFRNRQQSTILGIRSTVAIQLGLLILNVAFLILGLAAALGMFQLKRWGLTLGVIAVVYNLIMAGRSIYGYIAFSAARASGNFANFGGAGVALLGASRTFPILAIIQIVVAVAAAVLVFLPVTRKAFPTPVKIKVDSSIPQDTL